MTAFCPLPGKDTVYAETTIPNQAQLNHYTFDPHAWLDEDLFFNPNVTFGLKNNPDEKMFFEASVIIAPSPNSMYQFSEYSILLPLFSNENITGDEIIKSIDFQHSITSSHAKYSYTLVIRRTSESYYQYVNSLSAYGLYRYPDSFTSFSEIINIYSNINNGRGIFAAYNEMQSAPYLLRLINDE